MLPPNLVATKKCHSKQPSLHTADEENAQVFALALLRRKYRLVTGNVYKKVSEMCHITLNKTAIFGDNGTISLEARCNCGDRRRQQRPYRVWFRDSSGLSDEGSSYNKVSSPVSQTVVSSESPSVTDWMLDNASSCYYNETYGRWMTQDEAYTAVKENVARSNQVKRA
ncbi:SHMT domain-containing protein [Raphanus sativus]|nr:SHMT domain-containing protein [Raphanus sativus]